MAKMRVSELARELGRPSKQLIRWLNDHGEYVKTPSSTLEAEVAAKLRTEFEVDVTSQARPDLAASKVVYSTDEVSAQDSGTEWLVKVRFGDDEERYWRGATRDPHDFTRYAGDALRFDSRAAALNCAYAIKERHRNIADTEVVLRPRGFVQQYGGSGRA